jgi:hypothetical protein
MTTQPTIKEEDMTIFEKMICMAQSTCLMDKPIKPMSVKRNTPVRSQEYTDGPFDNAIRVYRNRPGTIALQIWAHGRPYSDRTCRRAVQSRSRIHADLSRQNAEDLILILKEAIDTL